MLGTARKCVQILSCSFGDHYSAYIRSPTYADYMQPCKYAIETNFGPNLFSLYDPVKNDPIFQIDANLGYPAAVLNALLQAPDVPTLSTPLTITLLPALPAKWHSGFIRNARIRGGITVDLQWSNAKPAEVMFTADTNARARDVRVVYAGSVVSEFVTTAGRTKSFSFA